MASKKEKALDALKEFSALTKALEVSSHSEFECKLLDTLYRLGLSRISGTLVVEFLEDTMKHVVYDALVYGKSSVEEK